MKNTVKISIALLFGLIVLSGVPALAADTESPQGSSGDLFSLALEVSQASSCPPAQDCSSPSYGSENPGDPSCIATNAGVPGCTTSPCTTTISVQNNPAIHGADAFSDITISGESRFPPTVHQKKFVGLCCW